MLTYLVTFALAATSTFGPKDVQPLLHEGNADSWASVGYLGESFDGWVALVLERGENENGADLRVTFLLIDSTGKLPDEKVTWATTDPERMDPLHAWEDRGAKVHELLERAQVHVGFKRFSGEPAKKPKSLDFVFETDPSSAGAVTVIAAGKPWFKTEKVDKPRLQWKGVLSTAKGQLHLFLLQRLGPGSGPDLDFLVRASL